MKKDVWSLVCYTLFAQMAVGAFLVLAATAYFTKSTTNPPPTNYPGLWVIFGLMVLSLTASLFHLGSPHKAYLSIANFGSSWLSAEILLTIIFTSAVGLLVVYPRLEFAPKPTPAWITPLVVLVGLALIYIMSRVYMLRTVPTWNRLATPVSFYLTTFLSGSLVAGLAIINRERSSLYIALNVILVALIVQFLAVVFIQRATRTHDLVVRKYRLLYGLRSGLLGFSALALFLLEMIENPGVNLVTGLLLASLLMAFISEVMGRYLFYMSYRRLGV